MPRKVKIQKSEAVVVRECVVHLQKTFGDFKRITIEIVPTRGKGEAQVTIETRSRLYPLYTCEECEDTGWLDPNDHGGMAYRCSCSRSKRKLQKETA